MFWAPGTEVCLRWPPVASVAHQVRRRAERGFLPVLVARSPGSFLGKQMHVLKFTLLSLVCASLQCRSMSSWCRTRSSSSTGTPSRGVNCSWAHLHPSDCRGTRGSCPPVTCLSRENIPHLWFLGPCSPSRRRFLSLRCWQVWFIFWDDERVGQGCGRKEQEGKELSHDFSQEEITQTEKTL